MLLVNLLLWGQTKVQYSCVYCTYVAIRIYDNKMYEKFRDNCNPVMQES